MQKPQKVKRIKETASAGAVSAGGMAVAGAGSLFGGKKKKTKENSTGLRPLIIKRISENLIRVEDIVKDQPVYGAINNNEISFIKSLVKESTTNGLAYDDAVIAVTEYVKQLNLPVVEVNVIGPSSSTANANVEANSTTTSTMQKPLDQKGIDAIAQLVRNSGLNPSQMNQVVSKARMK